VRVRVRVSVCACVRACVRACACVHVRSRCMEGNPRSNPGACTVWWWHALMQACVVSSSRAHLPQERVCMGMVAWEAGGGLALAEGTLCHRTQAAAAATAAWWDRQWMGVSVCGCACDCAWLRASVCVGDGHGKRWD